MGKSGVVGKKRRSKSDIFEHHPTPYDDEKWTAKLLPALILSKFFNLLQKDS